MISIWTPSPRYSRPADTAVTERCATTSHHSVAPRASRGKSWVLAMLAPKRGLRVAPVPPKTADLTRLTRGRRDDGRSGRRNRRCDRTKERTRLASPCRHHHPSITVVHPMVGETEQTSHTEIRTLPPAARLPARLNTDDGPTRNTIQNRPHDMLPMRPFCSGHAQNRTRSKRTDQELHKPDRLTSTAIP